MIYIDPPYNTGSDFIYKDDFTLTMEEVEKQEGLRDKKGATKTVDRLTKNTKDSAKYHTNWLNMMYPRLSIARDLLADDGVIFISIDDNEVHNLKKICDEIFGESNFVSAFIWKSKLGKVGTTSLISNVHEYILCYSKNSLNLNFKLIEKFSEGRKENLRQWGQADRREDRPSMFYPITIDGIEVYPIKEDGTEGRWRVGEETSKELLASGQLELVKKETGYNIYRNFPAGISKIPYSSLLEDIGTTAKGSLELKDLKLQKFFDYPKTINLVQFMSNLITKNEDIILDFFSGSATTAHAVMQLNAKDGGNRKFIMVQVPELSYDGKKDKSGEYIIDEKTGLPEIQKDSEARKAGFNLITEIGKERIRRAGEKILEDNKDKDLSSLDIGFKTFKVDSSNFNEWDISYEAMVKAVKESAEGKYTTYKQDRSELDLVYEIMLKEGLQLTEEVEEIDFEGVTIYKIANGVIYIFLGKLTKEIVDKIIEMKKEVQELFGLDNPTVILNETYLDSEIKANAKENFISNGIVNIKTL